MKKFIASFAFAAMALLSAYGQSGTDVQYLSVPVQGDVKLELLNIPAATFKMSDHDVTFSKDYYIGKCEVTQAQWQAVMGNNPSFFKGATLPVETVSWEDAVAFCKKLNTMTEGKRPAGYVFNLPTEPQWEYAARGGAKSKGTEFSGSAKLDDVAIFYDNSPTSTKPVCQKAPNELGLYDMSGNVWEWCLDAYMENISKHTDGNTAETGAPGRVSRGGCWLCAEVLCTVGIRSGNLPDCKLDGIGFRVALVHAQ